VATVLLLAFFATDFLATDFFAADFFAADLRVIAMRLSPAVNGETGCLRGCCLPVGFSTTAMTAL
jgi:hypothetical protein